MARDCGNISSVFPPGITRLWDLPFTIHQAIRLALIFLSFENLPEDERPPKRIWLNEKKMAAWKREVDAAREEKAKGNGNVMDMPQNQLLKEIFGGQLG